MKEMLSELELPFVATGGVLEAIKGLEWSMTDNDAVATGLSVWLLLEVAAGEFSAQSVWEMLYSDGAAPSLADATSLVKGKPDAPRYFYQARLQIRRFQILNIVLLQRPHPFCVNIENYYRRFLAMESMLHRLQQQHVLLPTMLLKRFAVQASNWYKRQAASPNAVSPPDFVSVFDDIELERPWEPNLSMSFLHSLNLTDFLMGRHIGGDGRNMQTIRRWQCWQWW